MAARKPKHVLTKKEYEGLDHTRVDGECSCGTGWVAASDEALQVAFAQHLQDIEDAKARA